jgi:hypothetical protein
MTVALALVRPATGPQLGYIRDLADKIPNWYDAVTDDQVRETVLDTLADKFVSFAEARVALDALVPLFRQAPRSGNADRPIDLLKKINPGKYALPRKKDGVVDFFEVVERKNGKRYLNQLVGGGIVGKFNRKNLSPQLQAAAARAILADQVSAAKLFAEKTTTCPRCFTALTNPRSLAAKIGPDCAAAWGWSW